MDLVWDIEPLVFLWIWHGLLSHWSSNGFGMGRWATGLLMDLLWDIELLVFMDLAWDIGLLTDLSCDSEPLVF